ncbi:hypothetical protein KG089_01175 [Carnobacteriaceae bacterium zg-ZUI252]|nr:hypothetical protein [Carnobacteriaceae bacterium zg-ZUI252]
MSILKFPSEAFSQNRLNQLFKNGHPNHEMLHQLQQVVFQTKEISALITYAQLATELGEYDDVIDTVERIFPDIETTFYDVELDVVYINAIIYTWQILRARLILEERFLLYAEKSMNSYPLYLLENTLLEQLDAVDKECENELKELREDIKNVAKMTYVQQQQLVPKLHLFNDYEFSKAARTLFKEPAFHPLLKAYVLDRLLDIEFEGRVTYSYYGKNRYVFLQHIVPIDDMHYMFQLEKVVEKMVKNVDDRLVVLSNARLYLSLLYPFEYEVFTSVEELVECVLHKHHHKPVKNEWIERIEQAISEMVF